MGLPQPITTSALDGSAYDEQWSRLSHFIQYNPGARHRRRITRELLKGLEIHTALDVGCGPGEYIELLHQSFPKVDITAVDLSSQVIQSNQARFPFVQFSVLDVTQEALKQSFDLVICCEVLEHLEERAKAFSHLVEMVGPSGYLLVTAPTGTMYYTERKFGHVSHPTESELQTLCQKHGLKLCRALNWGWPVYSLTKYLVNLNPEQSIKHFANGDYSPLKKLTCHALYYLNYLNFSHSKGGVQLFYLFQKQSN